MSKRMACIQMNNKPHIYLKFNMDVHSNVICWSIQEEFFYLVRCGVLPTTVRDIYAVRFD